MKKIFAEVEKHEEELEETWRARTGHKHLERLFKNNQRIITAKFLNKVKSFEIKEKED